MCVLCKNTEATFLILIGEHSLYSTQYKDVKDLLFSSLDCFVRVFCSRVPMLSELVRVKFLVFQAQPLLFLRFCSITDISCFADN